MKTKKVQIFLGAGILLGAVILFSGCGKKTETNLPNLNQEKLINAVESVSPGAIVKPSGNTDAALKTPDPGNSPEGTAVKEVDALMGTVSSEDYNAASLDENTLLSE